MSHPPPSSPILATPHTQIGEVEWGASASSRCVKCDKIDPIIHKKYSWREAMKNELPIRHGQNLRILQTGQVISNVSWNISFNLKIWNYLRTNPIKLTHRSEADAPRKVYRPRFRSIIL